MEIIANNFSGFMVLLILGLRHGLDPDHITVIDGYTYRLHEKKSIWTRWVGTLFAFGHGVMVTLIALALSAFRNNVLLPDSMNFLIEWTPMLMLFMIGVSNLISLVQNKDVRIVSFRKWLLPHYFNSHLNPFSIFLTGLVFGFIFDTSTQIAAFGFTVSSSGQGMYALAGGIVFSLGLMLTGTFDSFLLSRLLHTFDQKKILNHRFKLTILITFMCFVIPIYKITCFYYPDLELDDFQNNLAGLGFITIIVLLYTDLYIRYKFRSKNIISEAEQTE